MTAAVEHVKAHLANLVSIHLSHGAETAGSAPTSHVALSLVSKPCFKVVLQCDLDNMDDVVQPAPGAESPSLASGLPEGRSVSTASQQHGDDSNSIPSLGPATPEQIDTVGLQDSDDGCEPPQQSVGLDSRAARPPASSVTGTACSRPTILSNESPGRESSASRSSVGNGSSQTESDPPTAQTSSIITSATTASSCCLPGTAPAAAALDTACSSDATALTCSTPLATATALRLTIGAAVCGGVESSSEQPGAATSVPGMAPGVTSCFGAEPVTPTTPPRPGAAAPLLGPPTDPQRMTLVLDLDGTLIASEDEPHAPVPFDYCVDDERFVWLRPGLRRFLDSVRPHFEVVLFTAAGESWATSALSRIDPERHIFDFRLYRDHTVAHGDWPWVKDLSRLGRDLARVVIVDDNPLMFMYQPDNALHVGAFDPQITGRNDDVLEQVLDVLLHKVLIADDVRVVLRAIKEPITAACVAARQAVARAVAASASASQPATPAGKGAAPTPGSVGRGPASGASGPGGGATGAPSPAVPAGAIMPAVRRGGGGEAQGVQPIPGNQQHHHHHLPVNHLQYGAGVPAGVGMAGKASRRSRRTSRNQQQKQQLLPPGQLPRSPQTVPATASMAAAGPLPPTSWSQQPPLHPQPSDLDKKHRRQRSRSRRGTSGGSGGAAAAATGDNGGGSLPSAVGSATSVLVRGPGLAAPAPVSKPPVVVTRIRGAKQAAKRGTAQQATPSPLQEPEQQLELKLRLLQLQREQEEEEEKEEQEGTREAEAREDAKERRDEVMPAAAVSKHGQSVMDGFGGAQEPAKPSKLEAQTATAPSLLAASASAPAEATSTTAEGLSSAGRCIPESVRRALASERSDTGSVASGSIPARSPDLAKTQVQPASLHTGMQRPGDDPAGLEVEPEGAMNARRRSRGRRRRRRRPEDGTAGDPVDETATRGA